jgi:hypothetical protein
MKHFGHKLDSWWFVWIRLVKLKEQLECPVLKWSIA